ncbi:alpha/beta hydrolase [Calothrix sp. 336/3]|uniref:alpha/beta hydrolase n=1 Tax=Calothrix sp. 336/3 TaxID=1337936 RepID=UPI000B1B3147
MEQFFIENPVPTDFDTYKALEIFWEYNFFVRHPLPKNLYIPILVITAGKDAMFTQKMGHELASHFINATHLHFANAGHLVMAECVEPVNQAIADWLKQKIYS